MIKLLPILLVLAYSWVQYRLSARQTLRALDRNSSPLSDPILGALSARMAKVLELPAISIYVYEVETINGLAAPDGRIFLTRGFIRKYKAGLVNADELVSVIAHELGHIALGHSRRRGIDFSGQNAIRAVLVMVLGRFIPGIGPYLAAFLTALLAARLSRQDEFEADAYASALLIKADIGTLPQKALFAKLEKLAGVGGGGPAWLASHPKVADRIRAIEIREQRWQQNEKDM